MHVHVYGHSGEAKIWLEPRVEVAFSYGLAESDVKIVVSLVEEHEYELQKAWRRHFSR
jgi:hypothetical protein